MIWRLRRLLEGFAKLCQRICPHPKLRWVGDAWDTEYICGVCDKRWFNETPKLKRLVRCSTGRDFYLNGDGGIVEEQT